MLYYLHSGVAFVSLAIICVSATIGYRRSRSLAKAVQGGSASLLLGFMLLSGILWDPNLGLLRDASDGNLLRIWAISQSVFLCVMLLTFAVGYLLSELRSEPTRIPDTSR
jgi:hypothetical protein